MTPTPCKRHSPRRGCVGPLRVELGHRGGSLQPIAAACAKKRCLTVQRRAPVTAVPASSSRLASTSVFGAQRPGVAGRRLSRRYGSSAVRARGRNEPLPGRLLWFIRIAPSVRLLVQQPARNVGKRAGRVRRGRPRYDFAGRPVLTVSTAEIAASRRLDVVDSSRSRPARSISLFFADTPASRHFCLSAAIFS